MPTTVNYPKEFKGFAITDPKDWDHPKLTSYEPKPMSDFDVDIEIECCGICGSELHALQNNWSDEPLACSSAKIGPKSQVVGHEIVGHVVNVGNKVTKFHKGERVAMGAQCGSCMKCNRCINGYEQFCTGCIETYCSEYPDGYVSQGGYASHVRAHEHYIVHVPPQLDSKHVAPLQCGGLTVYSPIKRALKDVTDEKPRVAIIGIGGLGHMAIMISKALGCEVWALSTSDSKKEDAKKMGADHFVNTTEKDVWDGLQDTFHLILSCTISYTKLPFESLLGTLVATGKFISVGLPSKDQPLEIHPMQLAAHGVSFSASHLGSIKELEELLALSVKHDIKPWVEELPISEDSLHEGLTRLNKGDVRYRFTLTNFHEVFGTG